MAMHTQNLAQNARASLFITVPEAQTDPLGAARLTLVGSATKVPESDLESARGTYLARHENAKYYVDFKDFSFWRLDVIDLYFVGGFGVMGWMTSVDRLGFYVRLKTTERVRSVRIGFPGEVKTAADCRKVLVAMVDGQRSALQPLVARVWAPPPRGF